MGPALSAVSTADPQLGQRVVGCPGRSHHAPGASRAELLAAVRGAEGSE